MSNAVSWSGSISGFLLPIGLIGILTGYLAGWFEHTITVLGYVIPTWLIFIPEGLTAPLILTRLVRLHEAGVRGENESEVDMSWFGGCIIGCLIGVALWAVLWVTLVTISIAAVAQHVRLISLIIVIAAMLPITPHLLNRGWDA